MRVFILALAVAGAMTAGAEAAEPTRSLLSGSEIRRNASIGFFQRYEVLRLDPNGTLSGNYESKRPVRMGDYERQVGDIRGRWSFEAGKLCFEGSGLEYKGRSCYAITRHGYSDKEYSGTHARTGDVWRFFIYPGN
jgi:hypothetical protein